MYERGVASDRTGEIGNIPKETLETPCTAIAIIVHFTGDGRKSALVIQKPTQVH